MPSRMMHLVIADGVAASLAISDRPRLLLGSVAPDGVENKQSSHFKGPRYRYSDGAAFEYGRFIQRYRDRLADPYFLGYLTHLVADDVLAALFYFAGMKAKLRAPGGYQALYDDYHTLNLRLARAAVPDLQTELLASDYPPDLEELSADAAWDARADALQDFQEGSAVSERPLTLMSFEAWQAYIERATARAIDICRPWQPPTSAGTSHGAGG